jgi:hypothetical protein
VHQFGRYLGLRRHGADTANRSLLMLWTAPLCVIGSAIVVTLKQQQFKEAKQLLANCRPCRFGVTMSNDILRHGLGLRIGIYSNDMNVRKTSKPRKADHAADKANPQASKAIRKALLNADTGHPSCHPHHAKLQSTASVSSASRHNCKKFRGGRRPRNILHLPSRGSLADLTIKSR